MNLHKRLPVRSWILFSLGALLLSAHGLIFYLICHHLPISAPILSGVFVIVMIKHLGAFSSLYASIRKRVRAPKM